MSSAALKRLSWDEYLAQERLAETKSEFYDGEVFAMAGAKRYHNVIAGNVARRLNEALDGRPCEVYPSDMRVRCPNGLGAYPDVSVACDPIFQDDREDTLLNPVVIVEVLSPSTESWDRSTKFVSYRGLSSLRDYVLVAQHQLLIDHYVRQSAFDQWLLTSYADPHAQLKLATLDVTLSVADIYARVEFPDTQTERSAESD
jgi:Uma2 family endonuclease